MQIDSHGHFRYGGSLWRVNCVGVREMSKQISLKRNGNMTTTLITGASSGIGRELAKQFASGGDDVVLVARSEDKLNELANHIHENHSVKATVIPVDLAEPGAVDGLCHQLRERSLQVDNLVNNAGFGALGKFAELSADRQTDMIMVNVVALTRLTRMLLPEMLQRGKGGVLNVGSIAAYQAGPNMCVYYASKAYVLSFTEGLREEVAGSGVHITCLEPGATETGFGEDSGMGKLDMFSSATMSAEAVAKAGYEGYVKNEDIVIPGWKNRLMVTSTSFLPRFATRKLVAKLQGV
jgi:short-subunit dehydrogenase